MIEASRDYSPTKSIENIQADQYFYFMLEGIDTKIMLLIIGGIWAVFQFYSTRNFNKKMSELEYSQNQEMKQLESKLEMISTNLTNSMNIASGIEESYRLKSIEAISFLWEEYLRIKYEFSPLIEYISILTNKELENRIIGKSKVNQRESSILDEYNSFEDVFAKIAESKNRPYSKRIFISSKLWLIFNCMVNFHARIGIIITLGKESGKFTPWNNDMLMKENAQSILSKDVWGLASKREFGGLNILIILMENEFFKEANKCMRNYEELAESVSEINQIAQGEEESVRLRRKSIL